METGSGRSSRFSMASKIARFQTLMPYWKPTLATIRALEMKSFQFLRSTPRTGPAVAGVGRAALNSGFHDSKPPPPETQGWFDSSADLKGGLQVQEEDFDSLPAEYRDVFGSR